MIQMNTYRLTILLLAAALVSVTAGYLEQKRAAAGNAAINRTLARRLAEVGVENARLRIRVARQDAVITPPEPVASLIRSDLRPEAIQAENGVLRERLIAQEQVLKDAYALLDAYGAIGLSKPGVTRGTGGRRDEP